MNGISLFSGIGGLDLGLERAGVNIVGQVEIDPWCREVLARHWPEVPQHDDVRTAITWWLSEERPEVDLICGGFPCQPVSIAGRQLAQADPRWLWPGFRDVIAALWPAWVLIENVPNLRRLGLLDVLRDLADLGFDAWWSRVPAAGLGAPHLRWRLIILAWHPGRAGDHSRPVWAEGIDGPLIERPQWDGRATWLVADPAGARRESPRPSGKSGTPRERRGSELEPRGLRRSLADTHGEAGDGSGTASEALLRPEEVERPGRRSSGIGSLWAAEPDVGRVADGIPDRLDRLRGLGNAVVPQVGEYAGRLLMAEITGRRGND